MKAALLVSSALLAIASASASAQGSITKVENGALVAANGMTVYAFDYGQAQRRHQRLHGPMRILLAALQGQRDRCPGRPLHDHQAR